MPEALKPYWRLPPPLSAETELLETRREGEEIWLLLAECIFYPASGGQRPDRGRLGEQAVADVQLRDGRTWLRVAREPQPGPLLQAVDAAARRDHSEQHSGQHLLSAVFLDLAGAATLSFHMGERVSTVELDLDAPSPELDAAVTGRCNALIRAGLPLRALYPTAAEAAELELRKEPGEHEQLRVIEIEGIDRSPCGGTHVAGTGELGALYLGRWERIRGRWRVEFRVGGRAHAEADAALRLRRELAEGLSCGAEELPRRVTSLREDAARLPGLRRRLRTLAAEAAARDLVSATGWRELASGWRWLEWEPGVEAAAEPGDVAGALCAEPGRLLLSHRRDGDLLRLHLQRSRGDGPHLGDLLGVELRRCGGRGGGGPDRAQGQAPASAAAGLLAALRRALGAA